MTAALPPLRLMQFCTDFPKGGGIQTHVADLSRWLRAKGHHVTFAGEPGASADPETCDAMIALPMWRVNGRGGGRLARVRAAFQAARLLRRALRQAPVDLIHVHETAPALVARLATFGTGIPVLMTFHGSPPERFAAVARIARCCSDRTASPSRTVLDGLILAGLPAERAEVLGLGIKPLPEVTADEVAGLRRTYLPDGKGFLIFSASRLAPQKGIDVMIEVARRVTARHPEVQFVVGGHGPLADQVDGWARAAGMAGHMRFPGSLPTVPRHLKACDLYLLTSRWEALPISIVEAFRAGRPVVATDCGGVAELVDESVGALCPVGDVGALTAAVLALIADEGLRRARGAAALERSREARFDPEAVHGHIEATYRRMVGRAG